MERQTFAVTFMAMIALLLSGSEGRNVEIEAEPGSPWKLARPEKDVQLSFHKDNINFVCPEVPELICPPTPECPKCPDCPDVRCPDPSSWIKFLRCPETKLTPCPDLSKSSVTCPEPRTCPEPTPCPNTTPVPPRPTTLSPKPDTSETPTSSQPTLNQETTPASPSQTTGSPKPETSNETPTSSQPNLNQDTTPTSPSPTTVSPKPEASSETSGLSQNNEESTTYLKTLFAHHLQRLDDDGWIVFQKRINGDIDFYRGWQDYKEGFGDFPHGDFWMGNELVHQLSSIGRWELRVEITFNGTEYFAVYSNFSVAGEEENYKLTVGGYSGTAGDELSIHNGKGFTTYDKDNDKSLNLNCAYTFHGAWWYSACHDSNLNGIWGSQVKGMGVVWHDTTTSTKSATSTLMKMRLVA